MMKSGGTCLAAAPASRYGKGDAALVVIFEPQAVGAVVVPPLVVRDFNFTSLSGAV